MEARSDWYNRIVKEIGSHKDRLTEKEQKKYKLDLLLRIAGRVDSFYSLCGQCQLFQQDITQLTQDLSYLLQTPNPSKEDRKSYSRKLNSIVKHLQKEHKLVNEGQYAGMWIGIGTAIGVTIGAAIGAGTDNVGIGIPIGIAIGMAVGKYLDNKAKKEGRVI